MAQIILYTFLSISVLQLVFWIVFLIIHAKYKKLDSHSETGQNPISIIICAYNEIDNLKILIPRLFKQKHDNFEVIIVNDRSDDGTYDFLHEEKSKYENLQVVNVDKVHDHINAKKYAITLGIKAAKNELLLFTDADCKPNSHDWISEMVSAVDDSTSFVLGYSPYENRGGFLNAFIRFEAKMTGILYTSFALSGNPYMGVGRNLLYRKSLFMKNNGFNKFQNVMGGDDDLFINQFASKTNSKVVLSEKSAVYSIPKKTWKAYFKQKRRHLSVGKYYKFKDRVLLGLYSISHSLFWIGALLMAVLNFFPEVLFGVILFRILIVTLLGYITSKKFGERMNIWTVPAFDFIYSFYIIIAGAITIFTKRVTWR